MGRCDRSDEEDRVDVDVWVEPGECDGSADDGAPRFAACRGRAVGIQGIRPDGSCVICFLAPTEDERTSNAFPRLDRCGS